MPHLIHWVFDGSVLWAKTLQSLSLVLEKSRKDINWVSCHHGMTEINPENINLVSCHHGMTEIHPENINLVSCHHGMTEINPENTLI